ncbi:MAG: NAD(P)/FAD-dependent oxidoreductase, partial [Mesorhizobium sp.]
MTEKLVIIGNGMAPGRMLEHLLEQAPGRYAVTIFNAEPRVNYDRIMLSPVLSGEKAYEEIIIHGDGWYIKHGITLYKGHKIVAIDRTAKTITSDHGVTVLHVMPTLMERQLDPAAGYLLQRAVEERGIKVITKANTQAITGNGKVEQVELADGTIIPATLVVMAVGIRPNA